MLYGAVIGDIVGSRFEFKHDLTRHKKDFTFFNKTFCHFTDDTILTAAVARAMTLSVSLSDEETKQILIACIKDYYRMYPDAGYGRGFINWAKTDNNLPPYNSFGNGSAMRCSITGWIYNDLKTTMHQAKLTAEITHNHPEGIKGAQATAAAIYLARNGFEKEDIKDYIECEFNYNLNKSLEELCVSDRTANSCQVTVPEAIICFLNADSFEETIRNCVYIGGDTDTLGAIAGAISEAYHGIPKTFIEACNKYLDDTLYHVIDDINNYFAK